MRDLMLKVQSMKDAYTIFSPAGGGVIASAPALVNWYEALLKGHSVMTEKSRKELVNVVPNGKYNDAGYGLGVTVHTYPNLGKVISHDGLEPGYSSIVLYIKQKDMVVSVATNSRIDKVSTFNVHDGAITTGLVTELLPYING